MKKTLTTALLALACSVYAYGLTEGGYEWTQEDYTLIIKEDCTFSEAMDIWEQKHSGEDASPEYRIQFGEEAKGIQLTIDKDYMLPGVGQIDFAGECSLIYNNLYTLTSNPLAMPYIFIGTVDPSSGARAKANLAITFTDEAIRNALEGKDVSQLTQHTLVEETMFMRDVWKELPHNTVSFTFGNAEAGDFYKYDDTQSYRNDGLVSAGAKLEQDTAVLYFAGSDAPVGTGFQTGTFTVAFVGSNYIPVPEPATGTLSLLALAGLCARRRRK